MSLRVDTFYGDQNGINQRLLHDQCRLSVYIREYYECVVYPKRPGAAGGAVAVKEG